MSVAVSTLLDRLGAEAPSPPPEGDLSVLVDRVVIDSREVRAGSLFCAIAGSASDGHDYVGAAAAAGAAAAMVERPVDVDIAQIVVHDSQLWAGWLAASLEGRPSIEVDVVGVTGTNGKTSIVTLIEHIVNACGSSAVSLGTLTGALTTAPGPAFQRALRTSIDDGHRVVAAEVSSHALDQQRVAGTRFAVAVFTNLSQDHLDYHPTMEHYFESKARLFEAGQSAAAVIDISDEWGARLAERVTIPTMAVDGSAIAQSAQLRPGGSTFEWRSMPVALPLGGRFSVTNAVLAAEACVTLGFEPSAVVEALGVAPQIPGRFELVDLGQDFAVIVDYSHTPASVVAAVESARDLTDGRVLLVFGAAGDRDPGKRPLMGAAASAADELYITSDNPRSEDPDAIIAQVQAGVTGLDAESVRSIADREAAIHAAIEDACEGDVVVIAGKGHEDYQIIGNERRDFDDRVVARAALEQKGQG